MLPVVFLLAASGPAQPPAPEPPAAVGSRLLTGPRLTPAQPASQPSGPPQVMPVGPKAQPVPVDPIESLPLPQPQALAPSPALPNIADCLRACPPANDPAPFLRTPKVADVPECRGAGGEGTCNPADLWRHTWHTAARFKTARFDQAGERLEGDSLVIYEGMTLSVNKSSGVYDLSFTATAPPTAVTLRLQLLFINPDPSGPNQLRLTLPPIRLDHDDTARSGDNSGRTVRIHHRGYSELFTYPPLQDRRSDSTDLYPKPQTDPFHPQPGRVFPSVIVTDKWTIQRVGTARFGTARINADDGDR